MPDIKLGDLTHFASEAEDEIFCRAAYVTSVLGETTEDGQCLSLCVLSVDGQHFNAHVCQDDSAEGEEYEGGHWHFADDCQYNA